MDLLVIGSQETRNSSKRVRRNGEGKTDLLCSKRFLTRHCLLRTVLTFSHTSWSHYSKVFFVKGKGGKRGVANLFWATAKRREQRMTERRATKKSSTTEERATQDKASTWRREGHAAERTERGRHRHASTFFWRFSISWFSIFFSILMLPLAFRNSAKTENSLKWRIFEIISLSFARNLENWNFEILETGNM